ncbi:MAG TPA: sensor domain-containing diguanylate cyclase [Steroidobacteraceae bacterium]|jgi:two-component system cell cycle response regulator|nr:sensor domain-containing diguanylate cyclase [Steroidobacteraceae bacterium]
MRQVPSAASLAALEAQNRVLQARLTGLTSEVVRNNTILQKTQAKELELLRANTLGELFKIFFEDLKSSYQLDAVALALRDPDHEIRHLLWNDPIVEEHKDAIQFVDHLATLAPLVEGLERPWLGSFQQAQHAALFPGVAGLGSVALIPVRQNKAIEGILMFGSADTARFEAQLATDFLAHLGLVSAVCLENGVNRARLMRSGFTDYLTGFYNRRYLQARLREELARAQRLRHTVAFLMVDIDYFKQINDRFGHLVGDAVLHEVAVRIGTQMRTSDTGARFGGDEFALLLQEGSNMVDAERVAARILKAVGGRPITLAADVEEAVGLSIGVAAAAPEADLRDHQALGDRLIAAADAALYRAKSAGRNRVAFAEATVR